VDESDVINRATRGPVTVDMLAADLEGLGVEAGMTLLVHSSVSSLGWVCGGPQAVIEAVRTVLGPTGHPRRPRPHRRQQRSGGLGGPTRP
jgi:aminoglycoside 3-N-acetyltransferase